MNILTSFVRVGYLLFLTNVKINNNFSKISRPLIRYYFYFCLIEFLINNKKNEELALLKASFECFSSMSRSLKWMYQMINNK